MKAANVAHKLQSFQFLGIPPKGEQGWECEGTSVQVFVFPISRDPPEGGTNIIEGLDILNLMFPISRDPPEGGTEDLGLQ